MSYFEGHDANFNINQNCLDFCDFNQNFCAFTCTPQIIFSQICDYKNAKHMK